LEFVGINFLLENESITISIIVLSNSHSVIAAPDAAATSVTVKLYEISISDRKSVYRTLAQLTQKFINSFAPDDISELSHDVYGMVNVTLRECYVHSEAKYGRLDQSDFDKIFETLQSPKTMSQDFAALADIQRQPGFHRVYKDSVLHASNNKR
jgi:hypothetical protein